MIAPNGIAAAVPEHVTQTLAWIEDQIAEMTLARNTILKAFPGARRDSGNGEGLGRTEPVTSRPQQPRKAGERPDYKHRIADKSLLLIARAMKASGELGRQAIVDQTGLSLATVSIALGKSGWFEKSGRGKFDPWRLSETGKAQLDAAEPST